MMAIVLNRSFLRADEVLATNSHVFGAKPQKKGFAAGQRESGFTVPGQRIVDYHRVPPATPLEYSGQAL